MRTLLLLAVLSVVGFCAIIKAPKAGLNIGVIGAGDRLLNSVILRQPAIPNTIQYQDYIYRGNSNITAIRANEIGPTQNATAGILNGGLGWTNVTIRILSAPGRGYNYTINIWGR